MSKPGLIAAAIVCGSATYSVQAQTTQRDVKFSKELNKLGLTDYSIYFIKRQMEKDPDDIDLLKIQLAETFLGSRDPKVAKEGSELIATISESSKYYPFAQLTIGKIKILKKDYKGGIKYLKAFEEYCNEEYESDDFDKDAEKEGCGYLAKAYELIGEKKLAKKVIEDWQKRQGMNTEKPPQLVKLDTAIEKIEKAEETTAGGEKDTLLNEAIKILTEDVPYYGQNQITAASYYAAGRAYVDMGEYDKALEVMSQEKEFVAQINKAYEEMGAGKQAPGGFIAYWKGVALQKKAEEASGEEQVNLYKQAFIQYFVNLKKYEGNKYATKAYDGYRKCLAVLKDNNAAPKKLPSFNPPIKKTRESILSPEEGLMFTEKKYDDFIDIATKKLYAKRTESGAADALMKLALAYLETGRELEALAVADYMALAYPEEKETQAALTKIAAKYWKKEGSTPEETLANKKIAVREYGVFLKIAPDNPAAPDIATVVAQYYYSKAVGLAHDAKKTTDNKKKREITDKAIEAFKNAVPYYQYIADNFGVNERGISALYYIALCNSFANENVKAAEAYLAYLPKIASDKAKLADTKFNIGNNFFKAGQKYNKLYKAQKLEAEELNRTGSKVEAVAKMAEANRNKEIANTYFKKAVDHLNEYLTKWLNDPKYLAGVKDEKVKKITEKAYELICWSYDMLGERKIASEKFADFITRYPKSPKIPQFMQRRGELHAELKDFNTAAKILEELANKYPESPQGKRALFTLARSMYNIGDFRKSIAIFNKILDKKLEISVTNLKWVVKTMTKTDEDNKADAGRLIVRAGQELEKRLKNPVLSDWIGKDEAYKLKGKPKETKEMVDQLRERLYFNIGMSASEAGLTKEVFNYLGKVLQNENTPYLYDAALTRAKEYIKTKNYELARADLNNVVTVAMTAHKILIELEARLLTGDTYLAQDEFKRAYSAFNIIALRPLTLSKEMESMMTPEQKAEIKVTRPMVEEAIYKAAYCAAKLGNDKDKEKLVEKYKKNFPKGKYITKINMLPESVVPVQQPKTNKK